MASDLGFAVGEQARIKGTSATHASGAQPIGGCITVSITALAKNGRQSSKIFFIFNWIWPPISTEFVLLEVLLIYQLSATFPIGL